MCVCGARVCVSARVCVWRARVCECTCVCVEVWWFGGKVWAGCGVLGVGTGQLLVFLFTLPLPIVEF